MPVQNPLLVQYSGYYYIKAENACGSIKKQIFVSITAPLRLHDSIAPASCIDNSDAKVRLNVSGGTSPYSIEWNGAAITDTFITGLKAGLYDVYVSDVNNCEKEFTVQVTEIAIPCFFIPNAITPDGDGKNDLFVIRGIEAFANNELIVFNRNGNKIFSASPYLNTWGGASDVNGQIVQNGTYFYILKLGNVENTEYSGYIEVLK